MPADQDSFAQHLQHCAPPLPAAAPHAPLLGGFASLGGDADRDIAALDAALLAQALRQCTTKARLPDTPPAADGALALPPPAGARPASLPPPPLLVLRPRRLAAHAALHDIARETAAARPLAAHPRATYAAWAIGSVTFVVPLPQLRADRAHRSAHDKGRAHVQVLLAPPSCASPSAQPRSGTLPPHSSTRAAQQAKTLHTAQLNIELLLPYGQHLARALLSSDTPPSSPSAEGDHSPPALTASSSSSSSATPRSGPGSGLSTPDECKPRGGAARLRRLTTAQLPQQPPVHGAASSPDARPNRRLSLRASQSPSVNSGFGSAAGTGSTASAPSTVATFAAAAESVQGA